MEQSEQLSEQLSERLSERLSEQIRNRALTQIVCFHSQQTEWIG